MLSTTIPKNTQSFSPKHVHPFGDGAPREEVYRRGQMTLYRYQPKNEDAPSIPVCVCYALVNKPYMLDLSPKRSFIRSLIEQGLTVYLIEWDNPSETLSTPSLEDYIQRYLGGAVKWICRAHSCSKINLMGICQGGTFSLIYTALNPERVKNLVTIVTPVDFHAGDNLLSHFAKHWETKTVQKTWSYVPADFMNAGFLQLKPFELMIGKYLGAVRIINKEEQKDLFMRMEKWVFDSPEQSARCWEEFIRECYQNNHLVQNKMTLGGKVISLSKINCPVLNLTAEKDHMVPGPASFAIEEAISSKDYQHSSFPVGHIGIFVGGVTQKKVGPKIGQWLEARNKEI